MHYELTVTMRFDSDRDEEGVAKAFESLFEFGTIKDSIADGLKLEEDPRLASVRVASAGGDAGSSSAS